MSSPDREVTPLSVKTRLCVLAAAITAAAAILFPISVLTALPVEGASLPRAYSVSQTCLGEAENPALDPGSAYVLYSAHAFTGDDGQPQYRVLDVTGGSLAIRTYIQLHKANGTAAQVWYFYDDQSGCMSIRSYKSGAVLDAQNGGTEPGTRIWQYRYNNTPAQQWTCEADESGLIRLRHSGSGLYLTADEADAICLGERNPDDDRQLFRAVKVTIPPIIEGVYTISSAADTSLVFDIAGASTVNRANLRLWRGNGTAAQLFRLEYTGFDCYRIVNVCSGKVLDCAGGAKTAGTNVQQYKNNDTAAQRWMPVANKDGTYTLYSAGANIVLENAGAEAEKGTNLQLGRFKDFETQKYILTLKAVTE